PLAYCLIPPAGDRARLCLGGETAVEQRTGIAVGLAARVPDLNPAAGIDLAAIAWCEEFARRTAINMCFRVVHKLLVSNAVLCFEPCGPLGLRDVSHDPIILAGLQRAAVVVAGVGERCQRLHAQLLLCGFGHLVTLAGVVTF